MKQLEAQQSVQFQRVPDAELLSFSQLYIQFSVRLNQQLQNQYQCLTMSQGTEEVLCPMKPTVKATGSIKSPFNKYIPFFGPVF